MKFKNIKSAGVVAVMVALAAASGAAVAATIADNMLVDHTYNGTATPTWTVTQSISSSRQSSGTCDAMTCTASQAVFSSPAPEGGSNLAPKMNLPDWWPSYVRCTDYAGTERLLVLFATYDNGVKYVNAGDTYIIFNYDGSYRSGAYVKSCAGKSVATLYNEVQAFR